MAFKLKNAGGSFKTMGSSPSPMKATPDELREAGVSQGMISGDHTDTRNSADVKKAEDRWSGGNEKASKNTGRSLDSLVKTRKGLEKGSPEYNAIQNEINKSLGDSTRHKQEKKTTIGEGDDKMVIKKKGGEGSDDTNIKTSDGKIKVRDGEVKGAKAEAPKAEAPTAEKPKGKGKGRVKAAVDKLKKKRTAKKVIKKGRKAEAAYAANEAASAMPKKKY
jgi:hypothetical protein